MIVRPIDSIGWRTVVSGGSVQFISAESSKPTTVTSCGHAQAGAPRRAHGAERERVARAHDAVAPAANRRDAPAWPDSSE